MRLDKFLCQCDLGTRTEVKKHIKNGAVTVNDKVIKTADYHIKEEEDVITFLGKPLNYKKDYYYLFYKPAGCVTADRDHLHETVFSYFPKEIAGRIHAVGRLDLDTEGLLILTSDGKFNHHIVSPSHHVPKTYLAQVDQKIPQEAIAGFREGIDIGDEDLTLPAELTISEDGLTGQLTLHEGRFHQVKRMFQAVGCQVLYLKRISIGSLTLDRLSPGQYRELTPEEIQNLYKEL